MRAAKFVVWTIGISWLYIGLYWLLDGRWNTGIAVVIGVGYMFIPAIVAMVMQRSANRSLKQLAGLPLKLNRWWLVAWMFPVLAALGALVVSLLYPEVRYDPNMYGLVARFASAMTPAEVAEMTASVQELPLPPLLLGLAQALVAGPTVNAVAAWGEEVGWRGFLQAELEHLGFWRSAVLIGVIWGIWHAPLILMGHNYPDHPVAGVFMMIFFCLLLSPLIQHVRTRAGSVLGAAIFHGSINASAGLSLMVASGGSDLQTGLLGSSGLLVLAAANLGLYGLRRSAAFQRP